MPINVIFLMVYVVVLCGWNCQFVSATTYDTTTGVYLNQALEFQPQFFGMVANEYLKGYVYIKNNLFVAGDIYLDLASGCHIGGLIGSGDPTITLSNSLHMTPGTLLFNNSLINNSLKIDGLGHVIYINGGDVQINGRVEVVSDLVIDLGGGALSVFNIAYAATHGTEVFSYSDAPGFWINGPYRLTLQNGKITNLFDQRSINAPNSPIPMIRSQDSNSILILKNIELISQLGYDRLTTITYHQDKSYTLSNFSVWITGDAKLSGNGGILNYAPLITRIGFGSGASLEFKNGLHINYYGTQPDPFEFFDNTCQLRMEDVSVTCSSPFLLRYGGTWIINKNVYFDSSLPLSSSDRYIQLGTASYPQYDVDLILTTAARLEITSMLLTNQNTF